MENADRKATSAQIALFLKPTRNKETVPVTSICIREYVDPTRCSALRLVFNVRISTETT